MKMITRPWFPWLLLLLSLYQTLANESNEETCPMTDIGVKTTESSNCDDDDLCFCRKHSQTSLALKMMEYSSPSGSASRNKFHHIVQNFDNFFIDIRIGNGIFESVVDNMASMLEGYGLRRVTSLQHDNLIIFMTIFMNRFGVEKIQQSFSAEQRTVAVLILQTEQLCCSKYGQGPQVGLQLCHQSASCAILEYSDQNFEWFRDKNMEGSVMLMPTLNQGRLDPYYPKKTNKGNGLGTGDKEILSLSNRNIDAVFFGLMTERRKVMVAVLTEKNAILNNPLHLHIEDNPNRNEMAKTYANSKVCLVIHSFGDEVPGETHRLSEMANSGCVPLMETFGDSLAVDTYRRCGGVEFYSSVDELMVKLSNTLAADKLSRYESTLHQRIRWWENRVDWNSLLISFFGPRTRQGITHG